MYVPQPPATDRARKTSPGGWHCGKCASGVCFFCTEIVSPTYKQKLAIIINIKTIITVLTVYKCVFVVYKCHQRDGIVGNMLVVCVFYLNSLFTSSSTCLRPCNFRDLSFILFLGVSRRVVPSPCGICDFCLLFKKSAHITAYNMTLTKESFKINKL